MDTDNIRMPADGYASKIKRIYMDMDIDLTYISGYECPWTGLINIVDRPLKVQSLKK